MKILLIRFSSFGDVTQTLSVPSALVTRFPGAQIHWVTRKEFLPLIESNCNVKKIWALDRRTGFFGVLKMAFRLRTEKFDRIYDAHNNLRSKVICAVVCFLGSAQLLRRKTKRWKRFLLFRFRINTFEMPFSGQRDLLEPLQAWGISPTPLPAAPVLFPSEKDTFEAIRLVSNFDAFIALAPSAAHTLKRWPVSSWKNLISLMPSKKFVLLGGPEDTFFAEIVAVDPSRVMNLAGKCGLGVSAAVVRGAEMLVTNDTGLLHVAEQQGVPAIALMGPAPFGFPSRKTTSILQLDLPCRPCSKHGQGPCVNPKYHRCMVDIEPHRVAEEIRRISEANT